MPAGPHTRIDVDDPAAASIEDELKTRQPATQFDYVHPGFNLCRFKCPRIFELSGCIVWLDRKRSPQFCDVFTLLKKRQFSPLGNRSAERSAVPIIPLPVPFG